MEETNDLDHSNSLKKGDFFHAEKKNYLVIGKGFPVLAKEHPEKLPLNDIDIKIIDLIKNKNSLTNESNVKHDEGFDDEQLYICEENGCGEIEENIIEYIDNVIDNIDSDSEKHEKKWEKDYLLGFYRPYHFDPEIWGIYLKANGQARSVSRIYDRTQVNRGRYGTPSIESCYVISKTFTFFHEYYHHKIETLASRLEVITRQPHYENGFHCLYCKTFDTDRCLEEAFANSYAYFETVNKLISLLNLLNVTKRQLKQILRDLIIKNSPPGYRKALKIIASDDRNEMKKFEYHFFEVLLKYSYKLNTGENLTEMPSGLWKYFSHSTHPIINTNNDVTYVVEADEQTITQWRNFFNV